MPNQTTPEKPAHTPNDGNAIVSESAYAPNAVPLKVRLWNARKSGYALFVLALILRLVTEVEMEIHEK